MKRWKDTEYFLSEDGDVYRNGSKRAFYLSNKGYNVISIWQYNQCTKWNVHRIVAELYVENPDLKCCVNHIDGNKVNNHHSNLEWVTAQENSHHMLFVLKKNIGDKHVHTGVPDKIVNYLRKCKSVKIKADFGRIAKTYGVTESHIKRIYNGSKRKLVVT
jgi:hypothetical protein